MGDVTGVDTELPPDSDTGTGAEAETVAQDASTTKGQDKTIPYARFKQVNDKLQTTVKELDEFRKTHDLTKKQLDELVPWARDAFARLKAHEAKAEQKEPEDDDPQGKRIQALEQRLIASEEKAKERDEWIKTTQTQRWIDKIERETEAVLSKPEFDLVDRDDLLARMSREPAKSAAVLARLIQDQVEARIKTREKSKADAKRVQSTPLAHTGPRPKLKDPTFGGNLHAALAAGRAYMGTEEQDQE